MSTDNADSHPSVTFDRYRASRIGLEEAVLCQHKNVAQIAAIVRDAMAEKRRLLMTRLAPAQYLALPHEQQEALDYCDESRTAIMGSLPETVFDLKIGLVSAGTSDAGPMAEAARVLEYAGQGFQCISDVGVAGLWRLLSHEATLRELDVVIVFAGMDAALPSVVAGLVPGMVIGVPTSVGYGVAEGGRSALESMLSSCAPGICVVNIDNGYGAASAALRFANMNARKQR